jgi:hypothetical protein
MKMTKGAGCTKQAGLSAGAEPLHWVVPERAGGVERVGIRSGLHAGKERERKRKGKVGRLGCARGFSTKKVGEIGNPFLFSKTFSKLQNYLNSNLNLNFG